MSRYNCRFCNKPMEKSKSIDYLKKGEFDLGMIEYWVCKKCGVFLIEFLQNYSEEQLKEIKEYFKDEPLTKVRREI